MNANNLSLILTLAAATTLGTLNLNAAEDACHAKAKANQIKTSSTTTADPNPLTRHTDIVASPKVLATWPQMAQGTKTQTCPQMVACSCCKP